MPHAGTCSVGVELLEYVKEQDGGTTETVSEAPGAYGGCSGSHAAGVAPYETTSTLAPWSKSRGGCCSTARSGSKLLRPATKPSPRGQTFYFFGQECPWSRSPGRLWFTRMPPPRAEGPRSTGLQCQGFGQGSQLHWHINCLELLAVHLALNRRKRRLRGEYVLVRTDNTMTVAYIDLRRWSTLPSHVATHPPPPPLESEAFEVASCHSQSGLAQPGSR